VYLQDSQPLEQKFLRIFMLSDNANDTTVLRTVGVTSNPQTSSGSGGEYRTPCPALRLFILRTAESGTCHIALQSCAGLAGSRGLREATTNGSQHSRLHYLLLFGCFCCFCELGNDPGMLPKSLP
jgi:hypothetical protein